MYYCFMFVNVWSHAAFYSPLDIYMIRVWMTLKNILKPVLFKTRFT